MYIFIKKHKIIFTKTRICGNIHRWYNKINPLYIVNTSETCLGVVFVFLGFQQIRRFRIAIAIHPATSQHGVQRGKPMGKHQEHNAQGQKGHGQRLQPLKHHNGPVAGVTGYALRMVEGGLDKVHSGHNEQHAQGNRFNGVGGGVAEWMDSRDGSEEGEAWLVKMVRKVK